MFEHALSGGHWPGTLSGVQVVNREEINSTHNGAAIAMRPCRVSKVLAALLLSRDEVVQSDRLIKQVHDAIHK